MLLDAWHPGFIDMARGVEDTTAERGWTVVVSNTARDPARERTYLRLFAEQRLAGLIVVPQGLSAEDIRRIQGDGAPVVVVDRAETAEDIMSVAVDDVAGGELAARHLIDLGHRHLAFVGDEASAEPVRDRLDGVRKGIAEARVDVRLDILPAELTAEAGRARGEELAALPAHRRPTAVMSATDLLTFGVLQSLLQHGIRVPADVSLVGYDDIPFARYLSVPLTTVRRPHYEMGTTAAQMLTGVLAGVAPEQRHVIFQPEFVVRDSTDSPTAGAIEHLYAEHLAQQTLIGHHSPSRCRCHQHRATRRLLQPDGSGRPAQCSQKPDEAPRDDLGCIIKMRNDVMHPTRTKRTFYQWSEAQPRGALPCTRPSRLRGLPRTVPSPDRGQPLARIPPLRQTRMGQDERAIISARGETGIASPAGTPARAAGSSRCNRCRR
jgi:LacI family transcriptional regulator